MASVEPQDLISTIRENKFDEYRILEQKKMLAQFSEDEIMCVFNVTKKKLMDIRMRYSPYDLIATEYNHI